MNTMPTMRKMFLSTLVFAAFTQGLYADEIDSPIGESVGVRAKDTGRVGDSGVDLSLISAPVTMTLHTSKSGQGDTTDEGTIDNNLGLGLGYVHLPNLGLVWGAGLNYLQAHDHYFDQSFSIDYLVARGDIGIALNKYFYGTGGLNFTKVIGATGGYTGFANPALGFQLAIGARLVQHLSLEAGYTQYRAYGNMEELTATGVKTGRVNDTDMEFSGLALALHFIF